MNLSSVNSTNKQQATLSHFVMIQLLLILKKKQNNNNKKKTKKTKKTKSSSIMDFVIMENDAASKHVPDVQKMAIALSTREQLFKRWIALSVG